MMMFLEHVFDIKGISVVKTFCIMELEYKNKYYIVL